MAATAKALRFGQHLKELRIHLCQKSPNSKGAREFVEQHYVTIKQNNPKFPILIRECSNTAPKVFARYEFGKENNMPLSNMSSDQVVSAIDALAQK